MNTKDKYDLVIKNLNIKEYLDNSYDGTGITIASAETLKQDGNKNHGYYVYCTLKTYSPNAKIISYVDEIGVSATGDNGKISNFPNFVDWAIKNKADMITCSIDWNCDKESEKEAIKKLYDNGIIMFNASGNDNHKITLNSGDKASCVDVGIVSVSSLALDINGKETWSFENYGSAVDVVCFGDNLPFWDIDNEMWNSWCGSSASTPIECAMFSNLKSLNKNVNSKNVMKIIDKNNELFTCSKGTYKKFVLPKINSFRLERDMDWKEELELATKFVQENEISDGTRPLENITRQEMFLMLYRFNKYLSKC